MRRRASLTLVILSATLGSLFAQDFEPYTFSSEPLSSNLVFLTGAGVNLALCHGDEGILLVDSDYAEMSGKLRDALTEWPGGPARILVNTHWHFDHTGGNEGLIGEGYLVVAHDTVRRYLATDQYLTILDRPVPASPGDLPAMTIADSVSFHLNGEDIVALHLPAAHTDGDLVVIFRRANVIHAGDIFFNCGYPFIDLSHGGSIDGMIEAVGRILERCDAETRIIPGHGPLATTDDLRTYLEMLAAFRGVVEHQRKEGKSLAEVFEVHATADLDARYGEIFFSPELFTEMVYRSLEGGGRLTHPD
jgi:glyoxylase-like metal-dependent hydrolase (beta-lactamase superfamily II)